MAPGGDTIGDSEKGIIRKRSSDLVWACKTHIGSYPKVTIVDSFKIVLNCYKQNDTELNRIFAETFALNPKHATFAKMSEFADCSLRQGAGGTGFTRFGSRTSFLR